MPEDAGKGDDPRKINKKIWDENFEKYPTITENHQIFKRIKI